MTTFDQWEAERLADPAFREAVAAREDAYQETRRRLAERMADMTTTFDDQFVRPCELCGTLTPCVSATSVTRPDGSRCSLFITTRAEDSTLVPVHLCTQCNLMFRVWCQSRLKGGRCE
jgi:hypothetical protein